MVMLASVFSALPVPVLSTLPVFFISLTYPKVFLPSVLGVRIRRIRMFLGLLDLDPLVRGMDPDPDPSLFHKCVERTEKMLDEVEF